MSRGALIVLEGLDRTGKSTQCRRLVDSLTKNGYKAELIAFPNRSTAVGKLIGEFLTSNKEFDNHAIHLLFSANRWEMAPQINKMLNSGINLIVDRYSYSGVAYAYARKNLDLKWCMYPESGLPKPDLVLYLDLPLGEIFKRNGFGKERHENPQFQTCVKEAYKKIKEDDWHIIDANSSIDQVHQILWEKVKEIVDAPKGEIGQLWLSSFPNALE